jgi:hypothetical protein
VIVEPYEPPVGTSTPRPGGLRAGSQIVAIHVAHPCEMDFVYCNAMKSLA